jgi:hypothetical protein
VIADLDPDRAPTRSISAVDPLGDDTLGTKPAGVSEDGGSILRQVVIERDARVRIVQQSRQLGLTIEKRAIAQILAIMLDQVERISGPARQSPIRPR